MNELRRTKQKLKLLEQEDLPIKQVLFDLITIYDEWNKEQVSELDVSKEDFIDMLKYRYLTIINSLKPPSKQLNAF